MYEFIKQAYIHGMRIFTLSHDGKGLPSSRAAIIFLCLISAFISASRFVVISAQGVTRASAEMINAGAPDALTGVFLSIFLIVLCVSFWMFYLAWSLSNRIGSAFILVSIFTGPVIILAATFFPGAFGIISLSMALWETLAVFVVYKKVRNSKV